MRFSAQCMSSMQWLGWIDAITPSDANRALSWGSTTCACSMRGRRSRRPRSFSSFAMISRTIAFARSPIACTTSWKPGGVGVEHRLLELVRRMNQQT